MGVFRQGKPIAKLVKEVSDLLKAKFPNCELVVGAPDRNGSFDALTGLGFQVVKTNTKNEYYECLRSLDISIQTFDRDRYYFRASGTISDAISCGCYVICPDYPVFRHQITWPVRVGVAYPSMDELPKAISECIELVYQNGQDNQWKYREPRSAENIAKTIDAFISEKMS